MTKDFVQNMADVDIIDMVNTYKATGKTAEQLQNEISKSLPTLEVFASTYRFMLPKERHKTAKDIQKLITRDYIRFLLLYQQLYNDYSNIFYAVYDAHLKNTVTVECDSSFISAFATDDMLAVKLPHLPVKARIRSSVFQDLLRDKLSLVNVPLIRDKLIHIVHIYPTAMSELRVPDNDNYDIKRLIDVISDYTGYGDSGVHCSLFMTTLLTDDVPDGSYVIVTPKSSGVKSDSETLEILQNF